MSKTPWFARIREGLFRDPSGKHRRRMGEAVWLYLYLHMCADLETGQLLRRYKTIADETGIPESSAKKMMLKLKRDGYIKTSRLSRGLVIQITKWDPVKKTGRVTKYGPSENEVIDHIRTSDRPYPDRGTTDGPSLNGSKDKKNHATGTTDGLSNETQLTRPNTPGVNSSDLKGGKKSSKSKESKPANPDVNILMAHYHDEFLRIHGCKPELGGRAAKEFKTLLETNGRSLDEFKVLVTEYLSLNDPELKKEGYPVPWFPSRINGLLLKKKQPESEFVY